MGPHSPCFGWSPRYVHTWPGQVRTHYKGRAGKARAGRAKCKRA